MIFEFGIGFVIEVEFEIDCSGNIFGIVIVFWEIFNVFVLLDLFVVRGNVIFNVGDMCKMFKVKVLFDFVLEKEEIFVVKLILLGELVMYLKNGNV